MANIKPSEISSTDAEIDIHIDPSLIGGFILDIENTRMDASVAGQLNALKNKLKQ